MKRRAFVRGVAAAAMAATWPSWPARAFAAEIPVVRPGENPLLDAYMLASADHTKLLVLVIPQAHEPRGMRGRAFGAFLNFGSNAQLAPLQHCQVICAKMTALARFHPGAGEPLMVLLDPEAGTAQQLDAPLFHPPKPMTTYSLPERTAYERAETKQFDGNIALIARLIGKALPTDGNVAEAAAEVRARLVKRRVPGSRWADATGCGESIEGVKEDVMMGCGMGHVPEKARRFLYWFGGNDIYHPED